LMRPNSPTEARVGESCPVIMASDAGTYVLQVWTTTVA
jgi:hypothetical protein